MFSAAGPRWPPLAMAAAEARKLARGAVAGEAACGEHGADAGFEEGRVKGGVLCVREGGEGEQGEEAHG